MLYISNRRVAFLLLRENRRVAAYTQSLSLKSQQFRIYTSGQIIHVLWSGALQFNRSVRLTSGQFNRYQMLQDVADD